MRGLNTLFSPGLTINLEYIREARRLNPRQARWAMFFTHFVFTLSYRPGSKNVKADALSRLYDTEERSMDPTPILSASCLVAPVVWELDADIERTSHADPLPLSVQLGVCMFRLLSAIG